MQFFSRQSRKDLANESVTTKVKALRSILNPANQGIRSQNVNNKDYIQVKDGTKKKLPIIKVECSTEPKFL